MSHEFELHHISDQLKKLTDEQKRINRRILQSRRDEQFELDHIRRRFEAQILQLEERQKKLSKDMERKERELTALQKRIKKENEDEAEIDTQSNEIHHKYRRY